MFAFVSFLPRLSFLPLICDRVRGIIFFPRSPLIHLLLLLLSDHGFEL